MGTKVKCSILSCGNHDGKKCMLKTVELKILRLRWGINCSGFKIDTGRSVADKMRSNLGPTPDAFKED